MIQERGKVRGLGLCSGGLDSILSALVLRRQGIEVHWISFETPFFSADKARKAASAHDVPLTVRNITGTYLQMLKAPPCGYGKHMNPCMDCHALMFRLAGEMMATHGFGFLFSGEVLGQRPFSQTKSSLRYVEKHSGHDGFIIRPLSAQRLASSIPEEDGRVDRSRLLGFSGRSRKPQIRLAEELGVTDYPAPAGGCLLTEAVYSKRLRDLLDTTPDPEERDLHLLKYGRHLRFDDRTKVVVGRRKGDNACIQELVDRSTDTIIHLKDKPGPTVVIPGGASREKIALAGTVCASYSKVAAMSRVSVNVEYPGGNEILNVISLLPEDLKKFII